MILSPKQDDALLRMREWHADPTQQTAYFAGYAGTGKTTLAQYFAEQVSGTVLYMAFTGKAAHVMRSKGCHGASTIHSAIYVPRGEVTREQLVERQAMLHGELAGASSDQRAIYLRRAIAALERQLQQWEDGKTKPRFALNLESEVARAALVIVDECSMVDQWIGQDLESFGTKILAMGDPAQLPPVKGAGYFTGRRPDIMLTEVHRQAAESGILRLATDVREGRAIQLGHYGADTEVILGQDPSVRERVLAADQVLVGRNATRHASNKKYRELTNRGPGLLPVVGDKLVCLRNDHNVGLLNGSLWRVAAKGKDVPAEPSEDGYGDYEWDDDNGGFSTPASKDYEDGDDTIRMTVEPDETETVSAGRTHVTAWVHHFQGREAQLSPFVKRDAQEFTFGYALTVHKAQGSQFDDVVLFNEASAFRGDAQRWLYTGITRAARRLTVVQM